jgi:hypothetical protein
MVEIGEELRKKPNTGYLQKFTIASIIRMLISKSISLGLSVIYQQFVDILKNDSRINSSLTNPLRVALIPQ